jgi:hypothetical protein
MQTSPALSLSKAVSRSACRRSPRFFILPGRFLISGTIVYE